MSPWAPPFTSPVADDAAWSRRARTYRRLFPYCELCERRDSLQVHHCDGREIRSALGFEDDDELMTLCAGTFGIYKPKMFRKGEDDKLWFKRLGCHNRITNAHRRLAVQRGQARYVRRFRGAAFVVDDPVGYSVTIRQVTDAARPRYWARAWRRTFHGLPTHAVMYPRR